MTIVREVPPLLVGFDIESTGLDTEADEAISYGFAEFRHGMLASVSQFFVLPEVQIHPAAEKVHGVSFEKLRVLRRQEVALSARAGAKRAVEILAGYARWGAKFVGSNPRFDYDMLDSTVRRQGLGGLGELGVRTDCEAVIDIVALDRELDDDMTGRPRRGLDHLCDYYGVVRGHHSAEQDARAACEVLICQVTRALASSCASRTTRVGSATHS